MYLMFVLNNEERWGLRRNEGIKVCVELESGISYISIKPGMLGEILKCVQLRGG